MRFHVFVWKMAELNCYRNKDTPSKIAPGCLFQFVRGYGYLPQSLLRALEKKEVVIAVL